MRKSKARFPLRRRYGGHCSTLCLSVRSILLHAMKTQDSSVPLSPQQDSVTVKPRRKVRPEPAANTTRALLNALATLKSGDFSVRLPLDCVGIAGKVADTFNEVGFSH